MFYELILRGQVINFPQLEDIRQVSWNKRTQINQNKCGSTKTHLHAAKLGHNSLGSHNLKLFF